ncbi:hypothetical protein BDE02_11G032100 [Populus trichocarpa]|nr:hypothetical protein BDE02_11G032100 [Populus trichocarpa]
MSVFSLLAKMSMMNLLSVKSLSVFYTCLCKDASLLDTEIILRLNTIQLVRGLRMSSHGICSYTCRNSTVSHEYVDFMMNLSTSTICKFFMGVLIGLWQGDKIQNLGKGSWAEGSEHGW